MDDATDGTDNEGTSSEDMNQSCSVKAPSLSSIPQCALRHLSCNQSSPILSFSVSLAFLTKLLNLSFLSSSLTDQGRVAT